LARTLVLALVAGWLIAWNWLRLERAPDGWQAALIVALAVAPALARSGRSRLGASLVAFIVAAASSFGLGIGRHAPGRLLSRSWDGFLEFYNVRLPFDGAVRPHMHGVILLAVFAFTLAAALSIAARRPGPAALALLVGAGWPATLLPGHELIRGAGILLGMLVVLVGLREVPRRLGLAPAAGVAVILIGLLASTSTALAKHAFLNWQTWNLTSHHTKPVSISYVWDSSYAGLTFPRKRTTVLRIGASPTPHYWRVTVLNSVLDGRWVEDSLWESRPGGNVGEPGLVPSLAGRSISVVHQRVTVEGLDDDRLTGASVPLGFDTPPGFGEVFYDPSGTVRASRALHRGDTYEVTSYELKPTPEELARSKPDYPPLISVDRKYLEVERGVSLPPFGSPRRWEAVDAMFDSHTRGSPIAAYRPLERLARNIAGEARSPYAAAVALERWFRTGGGFVYDQHPPPVKAGVPPLVDFVTRTRKGYCQHFAGAMALMLRDLGIPARVAAGFNSGSYDKHTGEWTVTDHDAHTWVEVWFRGWGWLPFDPTPSRGGAAGAYSASSAQFNAAVAVAVLAGKDGLGSFAKHRSQLGFAVPRSTRGPGLLPNATAPTTASHGSRAGILGLLLLVLAGCVAAISLAKTVVRRSRYLTGDPRRIAAAGAKELRDILRDQLVHVPESATFVELARLAEVELGVRAGSFATNATAARFGPAASARQAAAELRRDLRLLRRGIRSQLTRLERARGLVSLRSLGLAGSG
jgi:transglutaminase-like putative cysteine protease